MIGQKKKKLLDKKKLGSLGSQVLESDISDAAYRNPFP
jgi:hypothetical protein